MSTEDTDALGGDAQLLLDTHQRRRALPVTAVTESELLSVPRSAEGTLERGYPVCFSFI